MEIKNKQVLITGANRGIGKALAMAFAEQGAHLHLSIRKDDPELKSLLEKAGAASVQVWITDLSTPAGTEQLLSQVIPLNIDILFNNAGLLTGGLLEDQPLDDIYKMFQVNLLSLVQLTRGIIPGMIQRGHGKIINNSSVSALMHFPCATTYAASKAAVWAFTDCLELELKDTGVSTLCLITPGIKTQMFDDIEVKYGRHLEVPQEHISPEAYAQVVIKCVLEDKAIYMPSGLTGFGVKVARHLPRFFQRVVKGKFSRS